MVPITFNGKAIEGQDSTWASAVIDKEKHQLIIKLVNMSGKAKAQSLKLDASAVSETITTLANANTQIENSLQQPDKIKPVENKLGITGKEIKFSAEPYSLNVLKIKLK